MLPGIEERSLHSDPSFPISHVDPLIGVVLPIRLACCPITLNPLQPDIHLEVHQFDAVNKSLIHSLAIQSYGPILLGQKETIESHRQWTHKSRVFRSEKHWLSIDNHLIHIYLRNIRNFNDSSPITLDFVEMSFPLNPSPTAEYSRTVRYFQGDYTANETYIDTFLGFYSLKLDDQVYRCVKLTTTRNDKPGHRVDTFIDTLSGFVVYTEIFKGNSLFAVQRVSLNYQQE